MASAKDPTKARKPSKARSSASEQAPGETAPAEETGPQECMPCRGAGQVVSNLGGESTMVACPWCRGSGERQSGIDAQAAWLELEAQTPDPVGAPTDDAA